MAFLLRFILLGRMVSVTVLPCSAKILFDLVQREARPFTSVLDIERPIGQQAQKHLVDYELRDGLIVEALVFFALASTRYHKPYCEIFRGVGKHLCDVLTRRLGNR